MERARTYLAPDGARIAYRLWRPGPPRRLLVLLHGLASNLTRWSEFVATTRLRDSWDLLRLDLRGHGESVHRGRIGMPEWCGDLVGILGAEGAPRAVLAGHCLGANVALHFAAAHPAAATGLVLIEPMFPEALAGPLRWAAALRPALVPVAALVRAANALGLRRRRLAPLDLERLDREARQAMALRGAGAFPEARYASPLEDLRSTASAAYLQDLLAVTAAMLPLVSIRAPALALLSTGGVLSDPEVTARLLGDLRGCEIMRLPARHWIPAERPVEMREAIERWCAGLEAM
jgi:pimeloyl-ACP methyl ester carboxylesterase